MRKKLIRNRYKILEIYHFKNLTFICVHPIPTNKCLCKVKIKMYGNKSELNLNAHVGHVCLQRQKTGPRQRLGG